jgi:hypothetical protein
MPLPPPDGPRTALHLRQIRIEGFARNDGLWDVEGHLVDQRSHDVPIKGGIRPAGEPLHQMSLRLTVDGEGTIRAAVATSDAHPIAGVCGAIAPAYARLVGVRVGPGFGRKVRELFPPAGGCTHLTELVIALGTGVLLTISDVAANASSPPFTLDGCHALMASGPVVKEIYPRWYREPTR